MAKVYLNRAWMTTATTGTGTMTLGSAVAGYLTFAEAGIANGDTVTYVIRDGSDFELGVGTYTSSGTTLSRDTVTVSKISGTAGTTKLTLSGSAEVFAAPAAADLVTYNQSGNVGIGVSPSVKLDTIGPVWVRGAAAAGAVAVISPDATSGTNGIVIESSFITGGNGPIAFKTATTERMRIDADGDVRIYADAGANPGAVIAKHWTSLTADYTLSNVGTEQKAFNNPTNGTLTLATGVYEFECLLYLTTMSATSGNLAFDPLGAGTAVCDRWGYSTWGLDNTTPTTAAAIGGAVAVTQQTGTNAVTAGTGTGMWMQAKGQFRVTTAGTIIPSVTLTTANAAVVKAGSWFRCAKIGETTETYVGAWT